MKSYISAVADSSPRSMACSDLSVDAFFVPCLFIMSVRMWFELFALAFVGRVQRSSSKFCEVSAEQRDGVNKIRTERRGECRQN